MSDVEWRYFRLEGKYLEMAKRWHDERNAAWERVREFLDQFGKPDITTHGFNSQERLEILAIEDVGQDRRGWRTYKHKPGYLFPDDARNRPREVREAGKAWAEQLKSLSHGGPVELWKAIGAKSGGYAVPGHVPGRPFASWWVHPCITTIGDQYFACVPKNADYTPPPDLPELKEWEYLKMEDEAEQDDGAAVLATEGGGE